MTRPIKFRAWDGEKMLDDVSPSVVPLGVNALIRGTTLKVMQFTGLLDKNGKEIFEGDIVEGISFLQTSGASEKVRGIVEPIEVERHFAVNWKMSEDFGKRSWLKPTLRPENMIEVIGNVWENHNLIKQ